MSQSQVSNYILLRIDNFRLLMHQDQMHQIAHIENRKAINHQATLNHKTLRQKIEAEERVFVALSESLKLLPNVPENRFIQTISRIEPNIHWCWNEVQLLNQVPVIIKDLPTIICSDAMPVSGIARLPDGSTALTSRTEDLLNYATQYQERIND